MNMMQLVFNTLKPALEDARTLPAESLPRLLGDLEEVRATALARLSAPAPVQAADELLTIVQACELMKCSRDFLYKRDFPFTRRLGRKLLFSRNGIDRYLQEQK